MLRTFLSFFFFLITEAWNQRTLVCASVSFSQILYHSNMALRWVVFYQVSLSLHSHPHVLILSRASVWFSPPYNSLFNSKKDKSNYHILSGEELSSLLVLTTPHLGTVQLIICLAWVQMFKFPTFSLCYSFSTSRDVQNFESQSPLRRWIPILLSQRNRDYWACTPAIPTHLGSSLPSPHSFCWSILLILMWLYFARHCSRL